MDKKKSRGITPVGDYVLVKRVAFEGEKRSSFPETILNKGEILAGVPESPKETKISTKTSVFLGDIVYFIRTEKHKVILIPPLEHPILEQSTLYLVHFDNIVGKSVESEILCFSNVAIEGRD